MAMAMNMMKSALSWTIAALVATVIGAFTVALYSNDNKPCTERRCYNELDTRLAALEASMKVRTADRYTGTDAKRDLMIINQRIDSIDAEHKDKR